MAVEKSLVLIKPDAMVRNLAGTLITELGFLGLDIIGLKIVKVEEELAVKHYDELKDKPFFPSLLKYITGQYHGKNSVIAICFCGEDAISKIRTALGATNPDNAEFTSIRGKYGRVRDIDGDNVIENLVHASSSASDGERETALWFEKAELIVA